MLLTSSQVSVLLSSGIIVLCGFALFISGYVIQQRTLRDLREAIRPNRIPRPSPKIYPPDQDRLGSSSSSGKKRPLTQLDDGTKITLDIPGSEEEGRGSSEEAVAGDETVVVVVRPTLPEDVAAPDQKPIVAREDERSSVVDPPANDPAWEKQKTWDGVSEDGKPLSRAERRKRIKEEIRRLSQGETPGYYQRRLW
ncbi:hypothetical protein F4775DRAFT_561420 [Biscogniauxia sp. FL1348]|nr:hypothetical protein F4775DRAFT_561420 [Biscogniauxia sp. FL1348]